MMKQRAFTKTEVQHYLKMHDDKIKMYSINLKAVSEQTASTNISAEGVKCIQRKYFIYLKDIKGFMSKQRTYGIKRKHTAWWERYLHLTISIKTENINGVNISN